MELGAGTRISDLLKEYPFLEDFLAAYHPKFSLLKNRLARATIGRVATLGAAASMAGLDLQQLLVDVSAEIEKHRGGKLSSDQSAADPHRERRKKLKEIIRYLHQGGDLATARARFAEAVGDVEASEIAAMEEELIREGLPVAEVQRLCDVHVGAFRQALDQHQEHSVPPGHPVHTYRQDNRVLEKLASALGEQVGQPAGLSKAGEILEQLAPGLENHYQRKENQLFPVLERHGVTGPSQVMWGVHDQIRAQLKELRDILARGDQAAFREKGPALVRNVIEMIYKEEKILFPMALQTLSEEEWIVVRRGEEAIGFVLSRPAAEWPGKEPSLRTEELPRELLQLRTGALTLEQLNLILTHLPVDISFVDENDTVRYYSDSPERIFPRSPAVIGRRVQQCHPPTSVHKVQEILDAFRAGRSSVAEFWIQLKGRFIHIRYFALRDQESRYRGCLEVSQDVTRIRELSGERRLAQFQ